MGRTLIHTVKLFDGLQTWPKATVIFDSNTGMIESVQQELQETHIEVATVVDGNGYTLLPGLIEGHMHAHSIHLPEGADNSLVLRTPLRCGITTVCDMHTEPSTISRLRNEVLSDYKQAEKTGLVRFSDLKSSLFGATIDGGWPKPIVLGHDPSEHVKALVETWPNVTIENAKAFVESHKALGADYIKLMQENGCSLALPTGSVPSATLELQTEVVKEAHAAGMIAVGHALSLDSTEIVLYAGADGLTHTFVDQSPPDSIVELYKSTGAFVIPTLCVLASLTGEEQGLRENFAEAASELGLINAQVKENLLAVLGMKAPKAKLQYAYDTVRRLKEEGIDIVAGTDSVAGLKGTAIGPSLWMELDMYVKNCGFSTEEALRTATSTSARRFGFHDRGVIVEGKRADLVLVKGDVLQSLKTIWAPGGIASVWKAGMEASLAAS